MLFGFCRFQQKALKINFFKSVAVLAVSAVTLLTDSAKASNLGCTVASHYGVGDGYHGLRTANGERFDAYSYTAAHPYLPFGTRLRVTNQRNGRSVVVRINDRGPYAGGRGIDLSYGAFSKIAPTGSGLADVCIRKIH